MQGYFDAMAAGAGNLFSWPGVLIPVAGTMMAMVTSFLPGIGASSLGALLLVLTLSWDAESVLLLFGALVGGATFMGSVTAILFNIPGSATSAASMIDGYPLARKGYPRTAIACAATASAVGSLFGVALLLAILPLVRPLLLEFGPLERLLIGVWGLTSLIALPRVAPLKGMVMALLGFTLAMIGSDPVLGAPRWTFGSLELYGGLATIPVLIGLLTFAEIIGWTRNIALEGSTYGDSRPDDSVRAGVLSVFRHRWLTLRSSIIGAVVGVVPGIGGTVASFVAYGQAVGGPDRDSFGQGNIRGLIAPEASVDAKDGGSLLPAIAFGLPGSEVGVLLVAMMSLHGIVPGAPLVSGPGMALTFTLVFALLFSNILTSALGLLLAPYLARLTRLRIDRLALPAILVSLVAVIQLHGQIGDFYTVIAFGLGGYFCKRYDWPRIPFIIAFILAGFIESNVEITRQLLIHDRLHPMERPGVIVIALLIGASLLWMLRKSTRPQTKIRFAPADVVISGALLALLAAIFGYGLWNGDRFSTFAAVIAAAAVAMTATCLALALKSREGARFTVEPAHLLPVLALALTPPATLLFGAVGALSLLTFLWISVRGGWAWSVIALAAVAAAGVALGVDFLLERVANHMLPPGIVWSALN